MAKSQRQYKDFVHEILTADQPPTPNPQHLDALLHWLAGRDTQPAKAIQRAFNHHQASKDSAQRHTLNYLDRVLFAHDADPYRLFGLIPGCDFVDIRARHKQLLQVFHPDRHQQHKDWFTRRSERLNHAYAHLKQTHGKPSTAQKKGSSVVTTPTPKPRTHQPPTPNPQPRARSAPSATHLRARLKEHLGNAATLQQRVFIVLFTVPAVLLLVLYVNNQGNVEGGSVATVAKNDPAPQAPDTITAIAPRDPAHLVGTPTPATEPEPRTGPDNQDADPDTATTEPEPLRLASRSLDGPHNGGGADDALQNDHGAPGSNEPSMTQSEPETDPVPDDASATATTNDSQLTGEGDEQATVEESHTDNTETASNQPESQSQDNDPARDKTSADDAEPLPDEPDSQTQEEIQTAVLDNTTTTETTGPTQTDQTEEAEQTEEAGEADNPQTTNETDSQPQEPESTPASETRIAEATTESDEIEFDSNTNHESPITNHESNHGPETQIAASKTDASTTDPGTKDPKEPKGANHQSPITNHDSYTDHAKAVNTLLDAYATAYKASNINQFAALFQDNAVTKYASGRQEIKKKYGEFFQETTERHVAFEDVRIQLLGNRQFKVTAQYQAAWTYPNGRSKTNAGRFQFHLTPDGEQLKIWRLNY